MLQRTILGWAMDSASLKRGQARCCGAKNTALESALMEVIVLQRNMPTVVKKYSNRRLYDTDESRYITLEELTEKIRGGTDVRVVDAKTGEDLTQATLTQVILEGPAARLLPVPLLSQLIRMQNDALGEFFGKYMSAALEMYLTAKSGAQAVAPYFPFATIPFTAGNAFARLFAQQPNWQPPAPGRSAVEPEAHEAPEATTSRATRAREPARHESASRDDVAELRKELDDLKKQLKRRRR